MIQTKTEIVYFNRSMLSARLRIEIVDPVSSQDGSITYTVKDWAVDSEGTRTHIIPSKTVTYSSEQIDQLDAFIEANYDLSGLTKTEKEYKKLQIGLIIDTQTNLLPIGLTIYGLTPNDWELC